MTEKDLRRTYHPNYFSIDYILACQTLIPCRTEIDLPKFGFLVPDCQSQNLPVGVNFQLPLWAARVMCKPGRTHVSVNLPPELKDTPGELLTEAEGSEKSPTDLKKINNQYFEVGHLCTSLFHEDASYLAQILPEVFQQRILRIGGTTISDPAPRWARKAYNEEPIPVDMMDLLELKIFQDSCDSFKTVSNWLEPVCHEISSFSSICF